MIVWQPEMEHPDVTDDQPNGITPQNVIAVWLKPFNDGKTYTRFAYVSLSEAKDLRDQIIRPLGITLFIHHNDLLTSS